MTSWGSKSNSDAIKMADSPSIDSFSRLRVSGIINEFETLNLVDKNNLYWKEGTLGSGSSAFLTNQASIRLRCTTANGDRVVRQTRRHFRYVPMNSQLIAITGVLGAAKTGVVSRMGYYQQQNGVYLKQSETGASVVIRSFTSGFVVENEVAQSAWNLDKFDGTGVSGHTLDLTKRQILIIDFQYLGVGRVRIGFDVGGLIHYVHEFLHANVDDTVPYMSTPNLPVRYEIENIAATASNTDLIAICCAVCREGNNPNIAGNTFSGGNAAGAFPTRASRLPMYSIRPKITFSGENNYTYVNPTLVDIYTSTNAVLIELVWKGTLTGAVWASVDAESTVEEDTTATAISGGHVVRSFFVDKKQMLSGTEILHKAFLTNAVLDAAFGLADDSDVFSVVMTPLAADAKVGCRLTWEEFK